MTLELKPKDNNIISYYYHGILTVVYHVQQSIACYM